MVDCAPIMHVVAYRAAEGYNGNTPGIGVLCALGTGLRAVAGTYRNSIERQSNYGAVVWQPIALGAVKFGAMAGAVTGYSREAMPLAALALSLPVGPVEVHTIVVPDLPGVSPATASFSVSFKF